MSHERPPAGRQNPIETSLEISREISDNPRLRKLGASMVAVLNLSVASIGIEQVQNYQEDEEYQEAAVTQIPFSEPWKASDTNAQTETVDIDGHDAEASDERDVPEPDTDAETVPADEPQETEELLGATVENETVDKPERSVGLSAASLPLIEEVFRNVEEFIEDDLPTRGMPYETYRQQASEIISRLPSLDVLNAYFPENAFTRNIEAQLAHIDYLNQEVNPTVEGFHELHVDTSRQDAFSDLENYHQRIEPKMFIIHWTGMGYDDVDHFIKSLRPYRVQYFLDADARAYNLFETDFNKPAHALSANDFSQGVEIETGPFDGENSPLLSYTPEQIEHAIYLAVDFLRRNDLPVDETTIISHYASDLIFSNPYYDPFDGRFTSDRIRKYDPPEELMHVIVDKAQTLNHTLNQ